MSGGLQGSASFMRDVRRAFHVQRQGAPPVLLPMKVGGNSEDGARLGPYSKLTWR
jgi:hypothetical protein